MNESGGKTWPKAVDAAEKTSAVFEPLIEELMIVRRSTGGLTKAVKAFAGVVEKPSEGMRSSAQEAGGALLERIDGVVADLNKARSSNREGMIGSYNDALFGSARELNMLSSLTLITTAHVPKADFDRQSFADDTRGMSARLLDSATRIGAFMDDVKSNRVQIERSLQSARKRLVQVLATPAEPATGSGGDESADARLAVSQAAAFKDRIAGSTQSMVACMQHPDALRQRAEHVDAIMGKATEAEGAVAAALHGVAAAHCTDMARELSEIIDDSNAALKDMIRNGWTAAQELRDRIAADDRSAALNRHRETIASTVKSVVGAHHETSNALSGLQQMQGMLDEIRGLFQTLRRERDTVRLSAFNASIAERRLGSATLGMNVVAMATRDAAEQCSITVERMTGLMEGLSSDAAAIDTASLGVAFSETEQAVSADEQTLVQLIADADAVTVAAQACEDSIEGLVAAAQAATNRLSGIAPAVRALEDLSETLAGGAPSISGAEPSVDVETALAAAYAIYTMESERRVHLDVIGGLGYPVGADAAVPQAAAEPEQGAAEAVDDACLDSILF